MLESRGLDIYQVHCEIEFPKKAGKPTYQGCQCAHEERAREHAQVCDEQVVHEQWDDDQTHEERTVGAEVVAQLARRRMRPR